MGDLVPGDDGLPVEEVGEWVANKHELLRDYIQISSAARKKFLPPRGHGGSDYIDLFCGPGRCMVKSSGEFVDGGCVAAWRKSHDSGAPFSRMIIGDSDADRLAAAKSRLQALGAPVTALHGSARDTAASALQSASSAGLNFAFLDPYSLGALDFSTIATLARLQRIDMLVHVSQMDLQRNFDRNTVKDQSALDTFAPGWRSKVDTSAAKRSARQAYFEYWRGLVAEAGPKTSTDIKLISGPDNQPLYLLLLAARHELAHRFWEIVAKLDDPQSRLL